VLLQANVPPMVISIKAKKDGVSEGELLLALNSAKSVFEQLRSDFSAVAI
jgi:hypothetical protein